MNLKRLTFIGFVIVSLIVIQGLIVSIYDLWHKQDLLKTQNITLERNLEENKELKAKLREAQTQEFIEKEARDKLFLSKPGEKEVLLPSAKPEAKKVSGPGEPNWKKWLDLFLPS